MYTERLESMSTSGFLRLIRQKDGDIIVMIGGEVNDEGFASMATAEFCTPFIGRGGSKHTYAALVQLAAAMAADNLDKSQDRRRPSGLDDKEQVVLVEWGRQCLKAIKESEGFEKDD